MKNRLFIYPVFIGLCFFISQYIFSGENDKYFEYASLIKEFDTTGTIVTKYGDGEINLKNSAGSILRFKVNKNDELSKYHAGIVFILFEFKNGWINTYKTFDINGSLKGDEEFGDLALVEYEIRKMSLLHAKFEILDQNDGNIEMNDAKDEIIFSRAYDSKNKLIKENFISTKEYWNANNVMYRP